MRPFKISGLAFACLLSLAGCGEDPAPEPGKVAGGASSSLPLAYAPADTPYVLGNTDVMPLAVRDAWWKKTESILGLYGPMLNQAMAEAKAKDGDKSPLAFAIAEELLALDTRAEFEAIGLGGESRVALYGVGLIPVFRMELPNPQPFKDLLARAESKAGTKFPTAKLGGVEYFQGIAGPLEFALAFPNGHMVASFWPKAAPDSVKTQLLAAAPPADNVLSSKKLDQLNSSYGFGPMGSGYIDTVRVVNTILAPSGEVDRELFKALEVEPPQLTEACRTEFAALATEMPRVAMGVTKLDATHMDSIWVFELKPGIAQELSAIAAPIPAVAQKAKWLGFGFGFDGKALASFIDARAKAISAQPYQCEELAELDEELAKASQQLAATSIYLNMAKGLAVSIDKFEMDWANKKPTSVEATVLLASDSPSTLLSMAAAGAPPIAALGLEPNGEPKALPMDQVPPDIKALGSAYAVMTDKALAIHFGPEDGGAGAVEATAAELTPAGTLMTYSFSGELYRTLGGVMKMDPSGPPEVKEAMSKLMEKYADMFEYAHTNFLLTKRGIEISQQMTMK